MNDFVRSPGTSASLSPGDGAGAGPLKKSPALRGDVNGAHNSIIPLRVECGTNPMGEKVSSSFAPSPIGCNFAVCQWTASFPLRSVMWVRVPPAKPLYQIKSRKAESGRPPELPLRSGVSPLAVCSYNHAQTSRSRLFISAMTDSKSVGRWLGGSCERKSNPSGITTKSLGATGCISSGTVPAPKLPFLVWYSSSRRSRRSSGNSVPKHAERRISFESNGGEKECRMVSADHMNHPTAQLRTMNTWPKTLTVSRVTNGLDSTCRRAVIPRRTSRAAAGQFNQPPK